MLLQFARHNDLDSSVPEKHIWPRRSFTKMFLRVVGNEARLKLKTLQNMLIADGLH